MAPRGIISLDTTSSVADGLRIRVGWSDVQPLNEDDVDWSAIDAMIAKVPGKVIGLSVTMDADEDGGNQAIPGWLRDKGVQTFVLPAVASGKVRTIVLPWDPMVLPHILAFIDKLAAKYDGVVDYIAIGGLGDVIESYIVPDPQVIGLDLTDAVDLWSGSCNAIIDAHMAAFKETACIFTASKPFDGQPAFDTLNSVVRAAAAKYGSKLGVMDCSLTATSSTGYLPNELVFDLSDTNPNGLQFLCSEKGFNGHTLNGTFAEAIDAALALKAGFVEIYGADSNNPANAAKIQEASAALKATN